MSSSHPMATALSLDIEVIILKDSQDQDRLGAGRSPKSEPHFWRQSHGSSGSISACLPRLPRAADEAYFYSQG